MKKIILVLALWLFPSVAFAQCTGVFPASTVCGVTAAGPNVPGPLPLSSFALAPGGTSGQYQVNNGAGGFNGVTFTGNCTANSSGVVTCITPYFASINLNNVNEAWVPPNPNVYHLFIANLNPVNQNGVFQSVAAMGIGAAFVPPNGTTKVHMTAQIWATSGVAATGSFVAKWIKNATADPVTHNITPATGVEVCAGVGNVSDAGVGTAVMRADCDAVPSNGDYFNLFMFIDSTTLGTTPVSVDSNPQHTYVQFSVDK